MSLEFVHACSLSPFVFGSSSTNQYTNDRRKKTHFDDVLCVFFRGVCKTGFLHRLQMCLLLGFIAWCSIVNGKNISCIFHRFADSSLNSNTHQNFGPSRCNCMRPFSADENAARIHTARRKRAARDMKTENVYEKSKSHSRLRFLSAQKNWRVRHSLEIRPAFVFLLSLASLL